MDYAIVKTFEISFNDKGYFRPSFSRADMKFKDGQKVVLWYSEKRDEYLIKKAEDINVGK